MAVLLNFGHDIWIAGGPNVAVAGFHYPTRMAVVRLADGSLFVWSPVRLTEGLRAATDALGHVRHIVAPLDWVGQIDQVVMRGNLITSEVVFFHLVSGTVLFTDLLQQIPAELVSGWRATIAKLDLMIGPEPSVPRKFRIAFTNRRAARAALQRVLAWPAEKVLMAHGTPVEQDAPAFLRRAFAWLAG